MQRIMIIRHAEKPMDAGDGLAVDAQGHADPAGLSVRGWQRAGALVNFFAPKAHASPDPRIATPVQIFAAASHARSRRPALTVGPLAAALGLPVQADLRSGADEAEVVRRALQADGAVLICWRHDFIHRFGRFLDLPQTEDCPWSEGCFDAVWVFVRDGAQWKWVVARQSLLAGDA